jgi:hypothetical protein
MATYKIVDTGHIDIHDDHGESVTRVQICGGDTAKRPEAMQELADFAEQFARRKRPTPHAGDNRATAQGET